MARYIADQNRVVLRHESGTYGTVTGGGIWAGNVQSHTPVDEENIIPVRYLSSADRDVDLLQETTRDYRGKIVYHPTNWLLLGFALGSVVDGGSPSPYTHTATPYNSDVQTGFTSGVENPFRSFQIEDADVAVGTGNNFIRTYAGCMVDTFTLNINQGDIAVCEVDYIAQSMAFTSGATTGFGSIAAPATVGFVRGYMWSDFVWHLPSGTAIPETLNLGLTIKNNLIAPHYINGSRVIGVPMLGNREYQLAVKLHATSERAKTFYDQYFQGGSTFNSMILGTALTGSRTVALVMSGCKIMNMPYPKTVEGVNEYDLAIQPGSLNLSNADDEILRYNPW